MSGKKKSDVITVLKNADDNRKELFDRKLSEYDRRFAEFHKHEQQVEERSISSSVDLNSEIQEINGLKAELKKTNEGIVQLNQEMTNIADDDAISREEWYKRELDPQYDRAKDLIKTYESIASKIDCVNKSISSKTDGLKDMLYKDDQKKLALSRIDEVKQQISQIIYINPHSKEKMTLGEASRYHLKSTASYDSIVSKIEELVLQVNQGITDINGNLAQLQEEMANLERSLDEKTVDAKETIQTVWAIEDALKDIGYNYKTSMIGETIHDGVSIITEEPAELVFSLKNIIEHQADGSSDEVLKVEFNVDNAPGSCSVTAGSLAKRLRSSGIDFQITDWGTAQSASQKSTSSSSSKKGIASHE